MYATHIAKKRKEMYSDLTVTDNYIVCDFIKHMEYNDVVTNMRNLLWW